MYELGDQFKKNLDNAKLNPECVFKGNKYRISILTERLVRIEYSESSTFIDYPTELVLFRNFKKPSFEVIDSAGILTIKTKYFTLNYTKEKSIKKSKLGLGKNLFITLNSTGKKWYYGHPEVRKYDKLSLYSLDGFVSLDDSCNPYIIENGTFKNRDSNDIDVYVFLYGTDFYYMLNDYFTLTGYPKLIDKKALGNWWDKDETYYEANIIDLIKKFEQNNIPISMLILNNWQNNNDYSFNEFYKNPNMMINYVKSKNIKLGLQIFDQELIKPNTDLFDKLKSYVSVDNNGNIPFNIYNERMIDAYLKLILHPLENIGADFFSLETSYLKNIDRLGILKYYLYYDKSRFNNIRPMIGSFDFKISSHRYPVVYLDKSEVSWESLKEMLKSNLSLSSRGVSYVSGDIGGSINGIEDQELFTRYVQLGVFSPILRLGSKSGKYYKREPWNWGLKTKEITTSFLNLRYKLIPYIYTELYKYIKFGIPLLEPLYYKNSDLYDSDSYKYEYKFGSEILVCPIYNKKDYIMNRSIHKIYIPEGEWYDFFTGKIYKGNRKYTSFYKDEDYPVFVKAGCIIPMSLNNFNDVSSPINMEILVFPGRSNTYSIYEDDGTTNNYLKGEYLITNIEFNYKKNNYTLIILPVEGKKGIIPNKRNYKIRFKNTKIASKVISYLGNTEVMNKCYSLNNDLIVEVDNVLTDSQLTIQVKGDNIQIEASRIINDDFSSIISDLPIKTVLKEKVDSILFSNELSIKKKRIEIRKLSHGKDYLEKKYVELFLKLLEYLNEV